MLWNLLWCGVLWLWYEAKRPQPQPHTNSSISNPESSGMNRSVRSCNCCPYGYHIDLDFVRYCEALGPGQAQRGGAAAQGSPSLAEVHGGHARLREPLRRRLAGGVTCPGPAGGGECRLLGGPRCRFDLAQPHTQLTCHLSCSAFRPHMKAIQIRHAESEEQVCRSPIPQRRAIGHAHRLCLASLTAASRQEPSRHSAPPPPRAPPCAAASRVMRGSINSAIRATVGRPSVRRRRGPSCTTPWTRSAAISSALSNAHRSSGARRVPPMREAPFPWTETTIS
ncbi:GL11707 [Drosophila persimilis]|uniref:GL11707 n=1 Tax=Drosophila persimilis TaxID=7234 RepID=B4GD68_DROPE|nr:GL11707 [Drosophila persimilis]